MYQIKRGDVYNMEALNQLLNNIINHGMIMGLSFLALSIMFIGYNIIWGGREGTAIAKKYAPALIVGAVCIFGALGLATIIRGLLPW